MSHRPLLAFAAVVLSLCMIPSTSGMTSGEEKKVALSPEDGFGPHDDKKTLNVPKTLLPLGTKAGAVLRNDEGVFATVAEIADTLAVLDYNHPLAGKPLVVQLKILKVQNP